MGKFLTYIFLILVTNIVAQENEDSRNGFIECDPWNLKTKTLPIPLNILPMTTGWVFEPAFSDEFTTPQLDLLKWDVYDFYCHKNGFTIFFNSPDNVFINNGELNLCAKPETNTVVCQGTTFSYSSGWIQTRNKFQYGLIEARIYMPDEVGFNPCFWLYGSTWTNPVIYDEYDEIDVFERNNDPYQFTTLLHNTYHDANLPTTSALVNKIDIQECYKGKYYLFAVEWLPEEINYYINGNLRVSVRYTTHKEWIDYKSEFTCANFTYALGQKIQLSMSGNVALNANSNFLETMKTDYLRAYKLQQGCNCEYYPLEFNPSDPEIFKVHKSIHLGGLGHTAIIFPGANMTIWATENIIFESCFTVNPGTMFSARIIKTQSALYQLYGNNGGQY